MDDNKRRRMTRVLKPSRYQGRKIPPEVISRCKQRFLEGETIEKIHLAEGVSVATITKLKKEGGWDGERRTLRIGGHTAITALSEAKAAISYAISQHVNEHLAKSLVEMDEVIQDALEAMRRQLRDGDLKFRTYEGALQALRGLMETRANLGKGIMPDLQVDLSPIAILPALKDPSEYGEVQMSLDVEVVNDD